MNKCLTIAACILLVCGGGLRAFAQSSASATATASATIVTPIAISEVTNLDYGNVAISAINAGTVIMPATAAGVRTKTGGVTLPTVSGTHQAASFNVVGNANYTYTVTLPSADVDIANGTNHMQVNTFTQSVGAGTLSAGGAQTIYVGATLNVTAAQAAGAYLSGTPFTVTVDYN